jgi:hypothetical protein
MKKRWVVAWISVFLLSVFTGCGSKSSSRDGSTAKEVSRSQLKADLKPHWVWLDSEMQGRARPLSWDSENTPEGLHYPRTLQLLAFDERDERHKGDNLFYVLSDGKDRSEISRVEYEIARVDLSGRATVLTGRREAIYQESDRRFLVSVLSELGSRERIDDLDLYVIRLRAHYPDQVQELRVSFRISGPLPALNLQSSGAVESGSGKEGVLDLAGGGHAWAYSETWENPSSRKMGLRFTLKAQIRWKSLLERTDFTAHLWSPPTGKKWIEVSETRVVPYAIRVSSNQVGEYVIHVSGKSDVVFMIAPKEELELTWAVAPGPHFGRCTLPPREVHQVTWYEERVRSGGRGDPFEYTATLNTSMVRETQLLGWNLERPYTNSFRMSALEAVDPRDEARIENILPTQSQFYGMHADSAFSSFSCQGLIE